MQVSTSFFIRLCLKAEARLAERNVYYRRFDGLTKAGSRIYRRLVTVRFVSVLILAGEEGEAEEERQKCEKRFFHSLYLLL